MSHSKKWIGALIAFDLAADKLSDAWMASGEPAEAAGYPFDKPFDEIANRIYHWRIAEEEARIADIREAGAARKH